jgi:tetratricopeptide (TPR) repeat protein
MGSEWDWPGAQREFSQALDLNPDCAMVHDYYAEYLTAIGQHDRALAAIKQAQELEPLALIVNCDVGWNLLRARRHPDAIRQLENTVAMDPSFALARWSLGCAYEAQGLYQEALAQFEQSFKLFDDGPPMLASQGHAYAAHGDIRRAQQVIDELIEISAERYVSPFDVALVYAGLDNKDQAFLWLEKACEDRPWHLAFLKVEPRVDPLRSDPRFKTLLHRLGLAG